MSKLLLTGSCGFILSNFIRSLVYTNQPHQLTSVDRINNNSANSINSIYWNKNHSFHFADIRDHHIMDLIFQTVKPDVVIHGASESSIEMAVSNPDFVKSCNIDGSQVIIDKCLAHNVKKLMYISTDRVYRGSPSPQNEEAPLYPQDLIGETKAMVEEKIIASGLNYNIVRAAYLYGPRQSPVKLLPKAIKCLREAQTLSVYDKGLQVKDWLHIDDYSRALLILLNKGEDNSIYNVSSGQEFNTLEIIHEVCKAMENNFSLNDRINFIDDPRGSGYNINRPLDSSKIRKLGWKPEVQIKKHLGEKTINWFVNNNWWLK